MTSDIRTVYLITRPRQLNVMLSRSAKQTDLQTSGGMLLGTPGQAVGPGEVGLYEKVLCMTVPLS